jgi:hypothetical protein
MKSNNALVGIALLFLILAAATSVVVWSEVAAAVKIGMFAFGFGAGIAAGAFLARRSKLM